MPALLENFIQNQLDQIIDTSDFMQFYQQHVRIFKENVHTNYTIVSGRLKCGTAIVQSQYDLLNYMVLYGGFLYQCLQLTIQQFIQHQALDLQKTLNLHVVDYACGQGSATLVLMETLVKQSYHIESLQVTLVEPSPFSLNRAEQLIRAKAEQLGLNLILTTHCYEFDALPTDFIQSDSKQVFFHLFTNILDLYCYGYYDLSALVEKMKTTQGQQYIFAMSTKHPTYFKSDDTLGFNEIYQLIQPQQVYIADTLKVENVQFYMMKYGYKCMCTGIKNVITYACRWQ